MWFHLPHQLCKPVNICVPMMLIINNAEISDSLSTKPLNDGNLVVGIAEPGAMIEKSDCATNFIGCFCDRANASRLGLDAEPLCFSARSRLASAGYPELRM